MFITYVNNGSKLVNPSYHFVKVSDNWY